MEIMGIKCMTAETLDLAVFASLNSDIKISESKNH